MDCLLRGRWYSQLRGRRKERSCAEMGWAICSESPSLVAELGFLSGQSDLSRCASWPLEMKRCKKLSDLSLSTQPARTGDWTSVRVFWLTLGLFRPSLVLLGVLFQSESCCYHMSSLDQGQTEGRRVHLKARHFGPCYPDSGFRK